MFNYSPGVNDRSGEILAAGQIGAAQTNADMMSNLGSNIGNIISQFAGAYAADKALQAKGAAYGDFMSKHGEQLGFNAEWIKDFTGRSPREQAMIGDNIIGMQNTGNRLMGLNSMQYQYDLYGPRRGAGGGGGGGAQPGVLASF